MCPSVQTVYFDVKGYFEISVFETLRVIVLHSKNKLFKDGLVTFDFTSFLTVLQSYQDNGWAIMKSCVQWNPVGKKIASSGDRFRV